jgi:hypothetical protein
MRKKPAFKGALHELLVSADLMRQGFYVFKNLSPDGKTDLLAMRGAKILRIQVKTQKTRDNIKGNHILAVVVDGKINYYALNPKLFTLIKNCVRLTGKTKCGYGYGTCRNDSRGKPFCTRHARRILSEKTGCAGGAV